jgi:O-antigen ligase
MSLSVFWALDPPTAASKLATYAQLITLYLVISLMPVSKEEYRAFLFTVVLSGVVAAAYSVYLYHRGIHVQNAPFGGTQSSRLMIKFGQDKIDPNEFSATFLLPIAIVMTWALRRSWSLTKVGLIGVFLVLIGGMYANGSRGAFVALAAMAGYMILRSRFKFQLVTLSLVALGATFFGKASIWARFASAEATGGAGRLDIWKVGFEAFKRHWLVGAGTGNFPHAYNESFISVYQTYYAHWWRAPHNNLVEASVELGVIGVVLLLCAWYTQWRSLRMIGSSSRLYDMRIALEGALGALFVASLFIEPMSGKFLWLAFEVVAVTRSFALLTAPAAGSRLLDYLGPRPEPHFVEPALKEPVNA